MTQSIKILQLNTEPPVSVYNHHAFGTGIITTAPWGMNWIYNNYIMLGFYPDEGALTFDFYMDYIYCQPVFDREFLSNSIIRYIKEKPESLVISQVNEGKYVECCVDEYYIPNREAYKTYHFIHNLLIYGYDDNKKLFYTAGYDENGKYTADTLSYKIFRASLPGKFNILKFRDDMNCELCPSYIQRQLMQYNGEIPADPVGSYPAAGRTIGIYAVDSLMDYIQNCVSSGEEADMRPTGILYNHRRLMCERMELMEKAGFADTEALNSAKDQLKLCEMLKNRQMLYNMRGKDGDKEKLTELTEEFKGVKLPYLNQTAYEAGGC